MGSPKKSAVRDRQVESETVAEAGGGAAVSDAELLGIGARDVSSLLQEVDAGFDFSSFTRLQKAMDVPRYQLAELVRIKPRTLTRREVEGKLHPDESERLLRAARLFQKAIELFEGDAAAARTWLTTSNRALSGKRPIDLARTEPGAREVENLIGRLEHGVFT